MKDENEASPNPVIGQESDVKGSELAESATSALDDKSPLPDGRSWWRRNSDDLLRDVLVALVGGAILLGVAVWFDDRRENRAQALAAQQANSAEVLENTRFLRQAFMDPDVRLRPFRNLNLQGAALGGLPLGCPEGVQSQQEGCSDLTRANLTGADLTRVDLRGAILSGADLTRANLTRAKLSTADFEGAAEMSGAKMRGANLYGAILSGVHLTGADFTGANLTGANLTGANLTDADLIGTNLAGADLIGADLIGADLTRTNLTGTYLTDADLTEAHLKGVCYDDGTRWPTEFKPPTPVCPLPAPGPVAMLSRGAEGRQTGLCSDPSCAFVKVELVNFEPHSCWTFDLDSDMGTFEAPRRVCTDGKGYGVVSDWWFYGWPNTKVYAVVGDAAAVPVRW